MTLKQYFDSFIIRTSLILLVYLSAIGISRAQNNPFKMDDDIYKYYLSIHDSLGHSSCPELSDIMFRKALAKKDMMGQSIALQMKASHYVITGDISKVKATLEEAKACKTIKLNYRFVIWKQLISKCLGLGRIKEGHEEILKMKKDAIKEKSDYGMVKSYFLFGIYFTVLGNEPAAMEEYRKGFEIAGTNYLLADPIEAVNYATLLNTNNHYEEAIKYLKLGLAYPSIGDRHKFPIYSRLLAIYSQPKYASNKQRAKDIKSEIDKIQAKGYKWDTSIISLYKSALFEYYLNVEKNYPLASKYVNSYDDSVSVCIANAKLAEAEGDFRKAYTYQVRADELYVIKQKNNQSQVQKVYDLKESLDEAQKERDRLMLANTQLLLEKSREHENFLQLDARAKEKELDLKRAEVTRQNEQLRHQQKEIKQRAENEELTRQNTHLRRAFMYIGAALILGIFIAYIIIHRQKEKKLCAQRDEAQNNERIKSLFLQNMSHEIRTPLNAIIGFNDIINNDECKDLLNPGEREEILGMIHTNAELLSTLVNDVLDISKFESGTYLMNVTDTNIYELCNTTLESVRMRAKSGVQMIFSPSSEKIVLHTDKQRLQQVIINFLTNACKYTNKGSITLSYEEVNLNGTEKYVRFAVTDTGSGVPKGEEENCFTRFQMLDKNVKGTGLGLHICRLISQMLHGRVYVDTSYTQGARFVFDHPL